MYRFLKIYHSPKLGGTVQISGAKNSALPLMAATILAKNRVELTNLPMVADIKTMGKLLSRLGAVVDLKNGKGVIDTTSLTGTTATYDIVKTMRASILVLGSLLGRFGKCQVSLPGGCAIGARPVDLHLRGLEQMGVSIRIGGGYIIAEGYPTGGEIYFNKITVTGTENLIMAAAMGKGRSKLINIALEPEVEQLLEVLKKGGVEIRRLGEREVEIEGSWGELLPLPTPIEIIPDRIEGGTYLAAGAIANSPVKIKGVLPSHMESILAKFREMGFGIREKGDEVELLPARRIEPVELITAPHPQFPTDMQAQFMAVATQATGISYIEERLFENRFMHVSELNRLGAKISIRGRVAVVEGPSRLIGADVMATDLRASSCLVLAGLVARGETRVHRIYHLFRGYEDFVNKFQQLGAKMELDFEPTP